MEQKRKILELMDGAVVRMVKINSGVIREFAIDVPIIGIIICFDVCENIWLNKHYIPSSDENRKLVLEILRGNNFL